MVKCVAFRSAHRYWKFRPQDGLAVLARGRIDVYEARGEYQLLVETLEPQGLGAAAARLRSASPKPKMPPAILEPLEAALRLAFGDPHAVPEELELRTDHGSVYTGSDCEELCSHRNLLHTFAPMGGRPATPSQNASFRPDLRG